jgi:HD-GYP domain-containing protein (c-di-GMP phosphodiesterase class II)
MTTAMMQDLNGNTVYEGHIIDPSNRRPLAANEIERETGTRFFSIPLNTLQVDTVPGFDIYLHNQEQQGYVLYRSGDVKFKEEHKDRLVSNKIGDIFITSSERRIYSQYVEDNLSEIISDDNFPREKKSKLVYDCSTDLIKTIFDRTRIADKIPRVSNVVKNTISHISKGVMEFITMLDTMSHDYYTINHSVNVCIIGLALGQKIGLNRNELHELGTGLILHDLGKSKIDDSILMKKGPLTDHEWKLIKNHPTVGALIAESTRQISPLSLTVIRQHHEKCNGKGYPIGLYEPQIHLFSRIATLADVYDALTTERPYNSALKAFPAIQLMNTEMSNCFSRNLFKELVLLLNEKPEQEEREAGKKP